MYAAANREGSWQLNWLGHSCFHIQFGGVNIITDPAPPETGYDIPAQTADIVTMSHGHWDHSYLPLVTGQPQVYDNAGTFNYKGIKIIGLPSFHDRKRGQERGENLIFRLEVGGVSLAHLGDLGEKPSPEVMQQLTGLDLLLIPVGGVYTLDTEAAYELTRELKPRVIVPMHYQTKNLSFSLEPVEKFILKFPRVQKVSWLDSRLIADVEPAVVVLDYLLTGTREEG